MPISNRIEHYFFGCSLRLGIGSSLCRVWFHWPILCDHVAASRNSCVQTTQRTNVDKTGYLVPKHAINDILRTADRAPLIVVSASFHRCAHVVDSLRARYGSVNRSGISKITEENFNIAIGHEFRQRRPSNENANTVPFLQESSNQMSPDQTICPSHKDRRMSHSLELGF